MEVQVRRQDEAAIISISGDVDLYSSPEVRKAITQQSKKKVPLIVVNLAEVTYMDSSGVATLVEGEMPAGDHLAVWDGRKDHGARATSGIYFLRLSFENVIQSSRLVLLR